MKKKALASLSLAGTLLLGTVFCVQADGGEDILAQSHGKERKGALQLLDEIVRDGNSSLCEDALSLAAENGRTDPDSIRQCYYMIAKKEFRPEPLKMQAVPPRLKYTPNLSAYDGLTGGASNG